MTREKTLSAFNTMTAQWLGSKSEDAAWGRLRAAVSKHTSVEGEFDYNRMRYDALWIMKKSLEMPQPLPVKYIMVALDSLQEYYERDAQKIAFEASCYEDSRNDLMEVVKVRSKKRCLNENEDPR